MPQPVVMPMAAWLPAFRRALDCCIPVLNILGGRDGILAFFRLLAFVVIPDFNGGADALFKAEGMADGIGLARVGLIDHSMRYLVLKLSGTALRFSTVGAVSPLGITKSTCIGGIAVIALGCA